LMLQPEVQNHRILFWV